MKTEIILSCQQIRNLDTRAINEFGIPSFTLMENAARACTTHAAKIIRSAGVTRSLKKIGQPGSRDDIPRTIEELERWKANIDHSDHPIVVLCGPGNNGGDGFAIARTFFNQNRKVAVFYVGDIASLDKASDDVKLNVRLIRKLGISIQPADETLNAVIQHTPLIIDALFGTGLTRNIEPEFARVIDLANGSPASIMAVDIPSGLNSDTGEIMGTAIKALMTVTFIALKPAFVLEKCASYVGNVMLAEIGIPRTFIEQAAQEPS